MEESQGHEGKFVRGEGQVGRVEKPKTKKLTIPFQSESPGQKLSLFTPASQKRARRTVGHVSITLRAKEGLGRDQQVLVSLPSETPELPLGPCPSAPCTFGSFPLWWLRLFPTS